MITVVGMWEPGFSEYDQKIEKRIWHQTIKAYDVDRWLMVGHNPALGIYETFDSMEEALATCAGTRVFFDPFKGTPIDDTVIPEDRVLVFGNVNHCPTSHATDADMIVRVLTPKPVDMFAVSVLAMALSK